MKIKMFKKFSFPKFVVISLKKKNYFDITWFSLQVGIIKDCVMETDTIVYVAITTNTWIRAKLTFIHLPF